MGFLLTAPDSSQRKRFSAIGIITAAALIDAYVVEGTVDGDVFYDCASSLSSQLMLFNGTNNKPVVILDSCSIPHLQDTLIHIVGALVIFLPPYS